MVLWREAISMLPSDSVVQKIGQSFTKEPGPRNIKPCLLVMIFSGYIELTLKDDSLWKREIWNFPSLGNRFSNSWALSNESQLQNSFFHRWNESWRKYNIGTNRCHLWYYHIQALCATYCKHSLLLSATSFQTVLATTIAYFLTLVSKTYPMILASHSQCSDRAALTTRAPNDSDFPRSMFEAS